MANERLLIPQDAGYFHALGLAAVAFARLEWDAVWCCERLQKGYISTIEPKKKTAGFIARDLEALFGRISDHTLRQKVEPFATEFIAIVLDRNALFHGKPGTTKESDQRLFRSGIPWSIQDVNDFADRCTRAGAPLNALLYDELKENCTVALN
ncbi:hypothetical protein [Enterobacter cloacae]|uniref:hypothetical protein n=1 Tax=Enterobacter cloacae TaxID=550 RepID=UPI000907D81F|nr:hypothetical protein [Enterobacter cloacae]